MIRYGVCRALFAGLLALLAGTVSAARPLEVYTVNYPLAYFAERIGAEHVEVTFPAPAALDPAFWQPDVALIGAYQQADLIVLNGANYAKWIDKVSLPRSRLVDTSKAFAERYIQVQGAQTHSHGSKGEHSHAGIAWTTWLDFELAALQARAIAEALKRKRPEFEAALEQNFAALEQDLLALDRQILELAGRGPGVPLLASHPVYQYLARRYGLNLKSVQWEPQEVPAETQWAALEALLAEHPAAWMIWEGPPSTESVKRLRDLGVESLVFDPAANRPGEGDFLSVMHSNVNNLSSVFATATQQPRDE